MVSVIEYGPGGTVVKHIRLYRYVRLQREPALMGSLLKTDRVYFCKEVEKLGGNA